MNGHKGCKLASTLNKTPAPFSVAQVAKTGGFEVVVSKNRLPHRRHPAVFAPCPRLHVYPPTCVSFFNEGLWI